MARFIAAIARHARLVLLWVVLSVIWPRIQNWAIERLVSPYTVRGQGKLWDILILLVNRPFLIPSLLLALILFYCFYESHLSGKPIMAVDGMPWRGPKYIAGRDGVARIVEFAWVSVTNKTEAITRDAIAESLGVKIRIYGRRSNDSNSGIWINPPSTILGERVDLHPDDFREVWIAVSSAKQGKMLAVSKSTFDSYSFDSPGGFPLDETLYLVRLRLRGIGVNRNLWFGLENFVSNRESLGIWGPLNILERSWVRLTIRGIGPSWRPYPGAKRPLGKQ